ncbi:hypothetical protein [Metaclostridioides mangenotii]|uniref:hypothetical protein n=2 Tax=Metaclostridioides mangenotii TaxID=1540 RepID=UPI00214A0650|nr:hypothetical protein [Clostridioides mangenotii]
MEDRFMINIITLLTYIAIATVSLIIIYNYGRKLEQEIYSEQRKKFEQLNIENMKLENEIRNKKQS